MPLYTKHELKARYCNQVEAKNISSLTFRNLFLVPSPTPAPSRMLRVLCLGTRNDAHSHDNVLARVLYNTYHGDLHVETPSSAVKIEHYEVYYELNGAAREEDGFKFLIEINVYNTLVLLKFLYLAFLSF